MKQYIDLRSDTVTRPTAAMRRAMAEAEVGDDVYGNDPTVLRLEELAAERMGKEAAMFVASGTMGNLLAIMTHTTPGDEIIVGARSHIVMHEVGGSARIAGAAWAMADNRDNIIRPHDVHRLTRPVDLMSPPTTLLCLENALADGNVVPLATLSETAVAGKSRGLAVHLDGARIFNAATALAIDAKAIANAADSVMFCLSKGLCAPVGSMLCGSAAFVEKARKYRKMIGGGMRQAGVLAAAGIIAIEEMTKRLPEDHANAQYLAGCLETIPGLRVKRDRLAINLVYWSIDQHGFDEAGFVQSMRDSGVLTNGLELPGEYRFVTHNDVSRGDIERAVDAVKAYVASLR